MTALVSSFWHRLHDRQVQTTSQDNLLALWAFGLQCLLGITLSLLMAVLGLVMNFNLSAISLLYVLLVVTFAMRFGFWQASVVSVAALLCQDYYFTPPAFTFYISDVRNAIAIVVFELVALAVSRLSYREKQAALEKERERQTMQSLYVISRGSLLLDLEDALEAKLAELICEEFNLRGALVKSSCSGSVGASGLSAAEVQALSALDLTANSASDLADDVAFRVLGSAEEPLGLLVVAGTIPPLALDSLASLTLLTIQRREAYLKETRAEAALRTEQLRTTVLDGLAHAFKTPLTIIRAASSGLAEMGALDEFQSHLTSMIDEQSGKLDALATRLLRTARVEPQNMCLESEHVAVAVMIDEVIQEFRSETPRIAGEAAEDRTIEVQVCPENLQISADHELLASTLKELLRNAFKYSLAGSTIDVNAIKGDTGVVFSVRSRGGVIQAEERDRIFDRFYRGTQHLTTVPGTGMGLSVARRVAEAHGGQIWAVSDDEEGTTFHVSLPVAAA